MISARVELVTIVSICGGAVATLFGGWNAAMTTLVIFMTADFITGLLVAGVFKKSGKTGNGKLKSDVGWQGLTRKGVTLALVLIAYRLDITLGTAYIKDAVIIGFITNELISITENVGLMGIKLPAIIANTIDVLDKRKEDK